MLLIKTIKEGNQVGEERVDCRSNLPTETHSEPFNCRSRVRSQSAPLTTVDDSYLVDPASRHMLVMRTKPCMSKYKLLSLFSETANGSLNQL